MSFCFSYRWFFSLLLSMFLLASGAFAQTRQSLEEQRKQALKEIEETSSLLKEVEQNREKSVDKLNLLNAQVNQFNRLIGSINAEIAYTDRQIGEMSAKITQMNSEIEKMKDEYARLVDHAYKNRGQYSKLIYVLSAKDFNEAYRRMKYFQQYSEYRKKQVTEINIKQEELRIVIKQLEEQKTEKEKLLAEQRQESRKLETVKSEQNREVTNLRSQERRLRSQLLAQQQKQKRIQNEIEKMIAADARKRAGTSANPYENLTPEERLISNNFKSNKGRLPWPVERGVITSFFGTHAHPFIKGIYLENDGIDITTIGGADVRAVFDGEVSAVGGITGDNMFITVRHGNYITVYSNLVEVKVKLGAKVNVKETIGKVYTEKGAKTAILKFQIREETNKPPPDKLNPEQWIVKQ